MTKSALKPKTGRSSQPILGYLDGASLLLWGVLLLKLWVLDQLFILIHPNYIPLAVGAGFVLLGLGTAELWRSQQQQQGRGEWRWGSGIFLATAIVGLLVNPRAFASDKAIHRGVDDFAALTRTAPASFRASNRPEQRTLLEWTRTIAAYPEPDSYTGQRAKVKGFVVKSAQLPDNVFLLTRFVITCCAADVYPVSLPVQVTGDQSLIKTDQWLEVEGIMFTLTHDNRRQLAIAAQKITPISEPQNPYDT
jgi:uncharacterized repeat protein (TIGR03943 family)